MASHARSPVPSRPPTFDQVFFQLLLWVSPLLVLYAAGTLSLAFLAGTWGALLVLPLGLIGAWGFLRLLGSCIVEVPFLTAVILSQRDNHRLEALRAGFYIRPDVLWKRLTTVSLRPQDNTRTVQHVALRGGPPLTIELGSTLRPSHPPAGTPWPRGRQGDAEHDHDLRTIGLLFLAHNQPERWERVNGNVIDSAVRKALSRLQVMDIYDPAGPTLDYDELLRLLNEQVAPAVEAELGFHIRLHNVSVVDGNNPAALEWRRRFAQFQQLAAWTNTPPDQTLRLLLIFQQLNGAPGGGMDGLLLYLLLAQTGNGGANPLIQAPPAAVPWSLRALDPNRPAA